MSENYFEPVEPVEQEHEPDPPEFDRSKVPDGPLADLFFDGRSGRGLTDAEYDEQKRRMRAHGAWPLDDEGGA